MTNDIKNKVMDPVDVIGVTFEASPESIGDEGGKAMNRLVEGLNRDGLVPAGPPRWIYHELGKNWWTIEACFPVNGASKAPEGLTLRRMEGGRAATAIHVGPYDELGMAYRELEVWVGNRGLETAAPPLDIYLNDPTEVKDPSEYETEIVWPVG